MGLGFCSDEVYRTRIGDGKPSTVPSATRVIQPQYALTRRDSVYGFGEDVSQVNMNAACRRFDGNARRQTSKPPVHATIVLAIDRARDRLST